MSGFLICKVSLSSLLQLLFQAENGVLTNGFSQAESEGKAEAEEDDAKILEPKEELQYLSEVLGFGVTFTDFPQKSTSSKTKSSSSQQHSSSPPEFITLVKLSTKPPKVSYSTLSHGLGTLRQYVHSLPFYSVQ